MAGPENGWDGRYVFFGVREHAMAAALNGIALHGGLRPYGGTFLVFSDYARPALRLAALMELPVVHVMTHDSIGLGEDGPTHQPVEHLASLRAMPGLVVLRPADAAETAEAWRVALARRDGPTLLALSRQGLEALPRDRASGTLADGGYVLMEAEGGAGAREATLLASGSEVAPALAAARLLAQEGVAAAVVSLPSWELFARRSAAEQAMVLGTGTVRLAVEAAGGFGWERFAAGAAAFDAAVLPGFGASGRAGELFEHFGFAPRAIADRVLALLASHKAG